MLAWESCGSAVLADPGELISLPSFCECGYMENSRITLICPSQAPSMLSPAVKQRVEEWPWTQPPACLPPSHSKAFQAANCLPEQPGAAQQSL